MFEIIEKAAVLFQLAGVLLLLPEVIVMNRLWLPGLAFGIPLINAPLEGHVSSQVNLPSDSFRVGRIECRRNSPNTIGINTLPTFGLEEWRVTFPVKTWLLLRNGSVVLVGRLPISITCFVIGIAVWASLELNSPFPFFIVAAIVILFIYVGVRQSRWSGIAVLRFLLESE